MVYWEPEWIVADAKYYLKGANAHITFLYICLLQVLSDKKTTSEHYLWTLGHLLFCILPCAPSFLSHISKPIKKTMVFALFSYLIFLTP